MTNLDVTTTVQSSTQSASIVRRLVYARDLWRELVARDIKLRYKRSFLGLAWSLVNPLAQLLVLTFVFRMVLALNIPDYPSFLFCGLLVWTWFQTALLDGTTTIVDNRDLIKLPGFRAGILPLTSVTTHLIHFVLALPILLIFLIYEARPVLSPALLALPFVIALQFCMISSLAFITAALQVPFRDTRHLLGVLLLLGFYLSPVFYSASTVPPPYQTLYNLNPMVPLLAAYRAILLDGVFPDLTSLFVLASLTGPVLILGYRYFHRTSESFVQDL